MKFEVPPIEFLQKKIQQNPCRFNETSSIRWRRLHEKWSTMILHVIHLLDTSIRRYQVSLLAGRQKRECVKIMTPLEERSAKVTRVNTDLLPVIYSWLAEVFRDDIFVRYIRVCKVRWPCFIVTTHNHLLCKSLHIQEVKTSHLTPTRYLVVCVRHSTEQVNKAMECLFPRVVVILAAFRNIYSNSSWLSLYGWKDSLANCIRKVTDLNKSLL